MRYDLETHVHIGTVRADALSKVEDETADPKQPQWRIPEGKLKDTTFIGAVPFIIPDDQPTTFAFYRRAHKNAYETTDIDAYFAIVPHPIITHHAEPEKRTRNIILATRAELMNINKTVADLEEQLGFKGQACNELEPFFRSNFSNFIRMAEYERQMDEMRARNEARRQNRDYSPTEPTFPALGLG